MAEMTVDQAQRCLDAMAKSEANTTAFIDIFGEIASLLERQQAEIAKKDRMIEKALWVMDRTGTCPKSCDLMRNLCAARACWLEWLEKEAEAQK